MRKICCWGGSLGSIEFFVPGRTAAVGGNDDDDDDSDDDDGDEDISQEVSFTDL